MSTCYFTQKVAVFICLVLLNIIRIIYSASSGGYLTVSPENVEVHSGKRVELNCSIHNISRPFMLRWDQLKMADNSSARPRPVVRVNIQTPYVTTYMSSDNTRMLVISRARPQDSGTYGCVARVLGSSGPVLQKEVKLQVTSGDVALPQTLCITMFQCKSSIHHKVFCRYVCDGRANCPDGSDEIDCPADTCMNKFRCNNSMCIYKHQVCDLTNNCGDFSDEENCDYLKGPTSMSPEILDTTEDDQLAWLKTTVYTVIACTVGIVLFISVVVIAVFRIKMKRAAVRRAMRRAERRNRHASHGNSNRGDRAHRSIGNEQEPFISAPSPTRFGNLIVNVNNGVQYVPTTEFSVLLQAPPSYSEVLAESGLESPGRHSPPPAYTTIDRNPNRLSGAVNSDGDNRTQVSHEENRSDSQNLSESENLAIGAQNDTVLSNQSTESTVNNDVADSDNLSANTTEVHLTDEAANDLEAANTSFSSVEDRHSNHKSEKMGCRPKQLQVRNGQIVLDGSSSGSSSPETVNRNTQTNPADYNSGHQTAVKPAQLQVQDGQIVLTNMVSGNESAADTGVTMETETPTTPGQLEVKEGQIVFKS